MSVLQFEVGDTDYIAKLNQMSQNAGDTAQLKADTEQIKTDAQAIKDATDTVKNEAAAIKQDVEAIRQATTAIAAGDLVWRAVSASTPVSHGDMLIASVAGIEFTLTELLTTLSIGQWFSVMNTADELVYVAIPDGLIIEGATATASAGDRIGISPGNSMSFRAVSLNKLRAY